MVSTPHISYFDGGVLYPDRDLQFEYNRIVLYTEQTLPGLGFVVQNTSRFASGVDIYANMVNRRTGDVVFVNKVVEITTRQDLDPDYPDDDTVLVVWLASGEVNESGIYDLQLRAIDQLAVTGQEYLRPIEVEILEW